MPANTPARKSRYRTTCGGPKAACKAHGLTLACTKRMVRRLGGCDDTWLLPHAGGCRRRSHRRPRFVLHGLRCGEVRLRSELVARGGALRVLPGQGARPLRRRRSRRRALSRCTRLEYAAAGLRWPRRRGDGLGAHHAQHARQQHRWSYHCGVLSAEPADAGRAPGARTPDARRPEDAQDRRG